MNRTDRLVAMVMHLQSRRVVRAEELATHFEVTVRTIYRDIAALSESGVPICGEAGVGYSLVKSFSLPPVMLTADEASSLFVGAEMVKQFTDASLKEPVASALLKLRAVLPRDRQEHVEQLSKRMLVFGPAKDAGGALKNRDWLLLVQRALVGRHVLQLRYRGGTREDETERDVEPLGLVFHDAHWYLVAWCRLRNDLRHFRLDRMATVALCEERFAARGDFSLTRHLHETLSQGDTLAVRIWFAKNVAPRARREVSTPLREETSERGGVVLSFATFSFEWLAPWILSFGENAEVIEPAELRDCVRRAADRIARLYASSPQREPRRVQRAREKEPAHALS